MTEKLSDLQILPSYHKGIQDIASEFYLPCMERAIAYDRAVAYFQSSILLISWKSLREFVNRGGYMRLLCSPALSPGDITAIKEGYEGRNDEDIGKSFRNQIIEMLNDPYISKPTKVLASLVSQGIIDIRIAMFSDQNQIIKSRLFHNKIGIFTDEAGNNIVFKGSMNETWSGLAQDGNIETIDVFVSWGDDREKERVSHEREFFESIWSNKLPTLEVVEFPDVARAEFEKVADPNLWPKWVDEITRELEIANSLKQGLDINPYPHQLDALKKWVINDRRGILKHATGSGKTITAIMAIREGLRRNDIPIVLVPTKELFIQWRDEIEKFTHDFDLNILYCGSGNTKWQDKGLLQKWTRPGKQQRLILSTIQTASKESFIKLATGGKHLMIIADEVHRLGSPVFQNIFKIDSGARLGLSATPERAGDISGTEILVEYFHGIIEPPFTLKDAIDGGYLTPYIYQIHTVKLNALEQEQWSEISKKIARIYARLKKDGVGESAIFENLKLLFIKRSRIVKSASAKPNIALEIIKEEYQDGCKWIVYCDNQDQLNEVLILLNKNKIRSYEYHSAMEGNREETLKLFNTNGGVLVSIKCLDEGVDIPSVTHALILASSKNPREFIQRRGRVLRIFPGKTVSFVHDVLVLPDQDEFISSELGDQPVGQAILVAELSRALLFSKTAMNPSAGNIIKKIAIEHDIDIEILRNEGYEDE